jgi:hypothetical protein
VAKYTRMAGAARTKAFLKNRVKKLCGGLKKRRAEPWVAVG